MFDCAAVDHQSSISNTTFLSFIVAVEKWASSLELWRVVTCCSVRKIPIALTSCRWQGQTFSVVKNSSWTYVQWIQMRLVAMREEAFTWLALYSVVVVATTVKSVHTTNVTVDQLHLFMTSVFPNGDELFQHDNILRYKAQIMTTWFWAWPIKVQLIVLVT